MGDCDDAAGRPADPQPGPGPHRRWRGGRPRVRGRARARVPHGGPAARAARSGRGPPRRAATRTEEAPVADRPVRGDLPLPPRGRPRRGRRLRGAPAGFGRAGGRADLRRPDHALGLSRRLQSVRRTTRGAQRQPVPHAPADARPAPRGDRGAGAGLRGPDRAGAGQPRAQRHGCGPGPVAPDAARPDAPLDAPAARPPHRSTQCQAHERSCSRWPITRRSVDSRRPYPDTPTRCSTGWTRASGPSPRCSSAA